jgi:pyruvate-formate lyase-activating enzyme
VMEFDHRPGEAKVSHVANMLRDGIGKARILVEISKCDLVCSNCHRIRTWKRQQES